MSYTEIFSILSVFKNLFLSSVKYSYVVFLRFELKFCVFSPVQCVPCLVPGCKTAGTGR